MQDFGVVILQVGFWCENKIEASWSRQGWLGEEKTCNARARTDMDRGMLLHAVGRLAFPMQHYEKKDRMGHKRDANTFRTVVCPLFLLHLFATYLDDIQCSGPHFLPF